MRLLFYFIHPAKFHAFRQVINRLMNDGHKVDIVIIKKDILEELVAGEGWNYTNIFPEGRRLKGIHTYLNAFINLFRTLFRLNRFIKNKQYDLCITDDLFTILGRIKSIPTIYFTDDDITAVPESFILASTAHYILAPAAAYMGRYEKKKIGYYGYKALAHLSPNCFTPNRSLLEESLRNAGAYFFIRCVSVTSTHDVGKKGISDGLLKKIVDHLSLYGTVIINSERVLPDEFDWYRLDFKKDNIASYIAFSKIFISDSTTMCAEAAILGVPAIEIDDWYADFGQYKDFSGKYSLLHGFKPNDEKNIFNKIDEMLADKNLFNEYQAKRKALLDSTIDLSAFMYWLFSEYPSSVKKYFEDKEIQWKFRQ